MPFFSQKLPYHQIVKAIEQFFETSVVSTLFYVTIPGDIHAPSCFCTEKRIIDFVYYWSFYDYFVNKSIPA
jgi:hypothetical protein